VKLSEYFAGKTKGASRGMMCDSQDLTLQAILSNEGRYCQADP